MMLLRLLGVTVLLVVAAGLQWSLPSRDIVRIIGTDIARHSLLGGGAEPAPSPIGEDIRFINTVTPDGDVRVYRNQDTGWGWPPYFKFDEADLAAVAAKFASSEDRPRWVVVTHYGWRIPMFSAFPNAISIREALAPDEPLFPWFNIAVVGLLLVLVLMLRRYILRLFGA